MVIGDSLGKNNDGIKEPIKAYRKTNVTGLGCSIASEISGGNWWERVFNEATNNLDVSKSDSGDIQLNQKAKDGVEITDKGYSIKKLKEKSTNLTYGSFLRAATLLSDVGKEAEIPNHTKTEDIQFTKSKTLSDAELFAACGGLTGHKMARHGSNLTGKLNRLAEQDKLLLNKIQQKQSTIKEGIFREINKDTFSTPEEWKKINNKKNKSSKRSEIPVSPDDELSEILNTTDYSQTTSKKGRKRKRVVEDELVRKIENILDLQPVAKTNVIEDSGGDIQIEALVYRDKSSKASIENIKDNSKGIKKKKKKKRKKGRDHLTEKAIDMIQDTLNEEHTATLVTFKEVKPKRKKNKKNITNRMEDNTDTLQISEKKNKMDEKYNAVIYQKLLKSDSDKSSEAEETDVVEKINEEMQQLNKRRRVERIENFPYLLEPSTSKKKCSKKAEKGNYKLSKKQQKMEKQFILNCSTQL